MPVSRTSAVAAAIVALAATVGLSGCGPKPVDEPAQPTPEPAPSRTRTPSPTPSTDEERASAKVVEAVKLRDEIGQGTPGRTINDLATVSRGKMLEGTRVLLAQYASNSWTQRGFRTVTPLSATEQSGGRFMVNVCEDASKVVVIGPDGQDVARDVATPLPKRRRISYEVTKAPQGFFVTSGKDQPGSC